MKTFEQYCKNKKQNLYLEFFDAIDGAVKHIDHLEENILNKGKQGVHDALNQIEASIKYFTEESDYKISIKFDGAPAVIAGADPSGRFFVASKSAFAKNPKINYTVEDIERNHGHAPGLVDKLVKALKYLPSLNIKGIYQMDFMFDDQLKQYETPASIDGVPNENTFITFTPNTIKYAVSPDSPYGDQIQKAQIGVAVHIEYEVRDGILKVKKYTSSPDEFSSSDTVFLFNVLAGKSKQGVSRFTKRLLTDVKRKKERVLKLSNSIKFKELEPYNALIKTYINSEIRSGRFLDNIAMSTDELVRYNADRYQKQIDKLKSDAGKQRKKEQMDADIGKLTELRSSVKGVLEITKIIAMLKNNLIKIFNEITRNDLLGNYLDEGGGQWQTTAPEGFALSRVNDEGAQITKMVDRQEFSAANFGTGKPGS